MAGEPAEPVFPRSKDLSDIFREVEQDLRRERASKLWEKYGIYVIGLAVAIVVGAAAIIGWQEWRKSVNEAASDRYDEVVAAAQKEKPAEAVATLKQFADENSGGYAVLARLELANALMEDGKTDEAVKAFEAVANDSDATDIIRGMATIKATLLNLDEASLDDVKARMMPLVEARSPWASNAHELMGLAAYRAGDYQFANEQFQAILESQSIPPGMRDRAHVMQAVLAPYLETAAADEDGKQDEAAATAGEEAAPAGAEASDAANGK
jgi:hypothetical protein